MRPVTICYKLCANAATDTLLPPSEFPPSDQMPTYYAQLHGVSTRATRARLRVDRTGTYFLSLLQLAKELVGTKHVVAVHLAPTDTSCFTITVSLLHGIIAVLELACCDQARCVSTP